MARTIILITGANRGIGRGLAEIYLSRPSHTVVAFVRDSSSETSQSLLSNHQQYAAESNAILIPYDASKADAAPAAISTLQQKHLEVTHIDLVISNAGFNEYSGMSLGADAECYLSHYMVNALSHLLLFGAMLPLMQKATSPKFIAISSATGSIKLVGSTKMRYDTQGKPRGGALPYTSSKCALNHMMVKLDLEHPDIAVGLFTPGPTRTGLGSGRFNWATIPNAMDVDPVVEGLVKQFDAVKKASGEEGDTFVFKDWKGDVIPS